MNPIGTLICIFMLAISHLSVSQTYFKDSSRYYSFSNTTSLSGNGFAYYSKELIKLDSSTATGEYYTVQYSKHYSSSYSVSHKYRLRAIDNKVFYTGLIIHDNEDSFEVDDLLIYDFNLQTGDTMKIFHAASRLDIQLLVDSVKDRRYEDGELRNTFYYSIIKGINKEYLHEESIQYAAKRFGSDFGLVPFKFIDRFHLHWQDLISICMDGNQLMYKDSFFTEHMELKDYCEEDSLLDMLIELRKYTLNNLISGRLKIYPNPVSNVLQIEGFEGRGVYKIFNASGEMSQEGRIEDIIIIDKLNAGLYFIVIENENGILSGSFLKI